MRPTDDDKQKTNCTERGTKKGTSPVDVKDDPAAAEEEKKNNPDESIELNDCRKW